MMVSKTFWETLATFAGRRSEDLGWALIIETAVRRTNAAEIPMPNLETGKFAGLNNRVFVI